MFNIQPTDKALAVTLQEKINNKTKPFGALGQLEEVGLKIGLVQETTAPTIEKPAMVVFAADHGIATTGVSPYPQEVTTQMVLNFLSGGAAINVFAKQNQLQLYIVDAGVKSDLPDHPDLIKRKIGKGTINMLEAPAMSKEACEQALAEGANIVQELHQKGTNCIGFGEMGIGNTSSASLLMSHFCSIPLLECVGSGTGLDSKGILRKCLILEEVQNKHKGQISTPLDALACYGGFEIVMMCGAILKAAELKMIILIDGFIASSALLPAFVMFPAILDYCLFSHLSNEYGHRKMLAYFKEKPLLQLDMRLGEGTGAALAFPIVQAAVNFINQMSSFESAGVSQKT